MSRIARSPVMRAAFALLLVTSCSKPTPPPPAATSQVASTVTAPAPVRAPAGAPGFAVVELFTSEGCSSCPPAEAVLHDLGESKGVIPLAFHVDYWNGSWVDRYSSSKITARQRNYAVSLGSGLYTPEMVVNGATQFVGSKQTQAKENVTTALANAPKATLTVTATRTSKTQLSVKWLATPLAVADLVLAITERDIVVTPNAGELAGETLHHDHVVRAFTMVDASEGAGTVTIDHPADVRVEKSRLIAFVQEGGQRTILGATVTPIP